MLSELVACISLACVVACGGGKALPATDHENVPHDVTAGAERIEVLRIEQEFHGNADYRVVIDAWVGGEPRRLERVTMGWLDTGEQDRRSPFGKGVRRHVDVLHEPQGDTGWVIALVAGDQRREIEVVMADDGTPRAWATIVVGDANVRCIPDAGRLVARTVIGIPVALDRLELECTDANGERRRGPVATTSVAAR
jgi:hypothetical protein